MDLFLPSTILNVGFPNIVNYLLIIYNSFLTCRWEALIRVTAESLPVFKQMMKDQEKAYCR
jgi:hypothetical protein